jgi:YaiO family outer membrane protein
MSAKAQKFDSDSLLVKARDAAFADRREEARAMCRKLLSKYPGYVDAEVLIARTYAWDHRYDSARIVTGQLYKRHPAYYDLLDLMTDIETWDEKYLSALIQAEKGLIAFPNDENFLYKKAWIQYLSSNEDASLATLKELFAVNPDHRQGRELYRLIMNRRYKDFVFAKNYFEFFKEPYLSRRMVISTGLSKQAKRGTYIAEVNMGDELPMRDPSFQWEAEAYQKLFRSNYVYLDYAWSEQGEFFPKHRGMGEFFQSVGGGIEISLGARFLYWASFVWIYTGSVSWMKNKDFLAFRSFISHQSDWMASYSLTYRRYFSPREDYMYAVISYGTYSDDFIQFNPNPGKTGTLTIGTIKSLGFRWAALASLGYAYDKSYHHRFTAEAGLRYYFNMFH